MPWSKPSTPIHYPLAVVLSLVLSMLIVLSGLAAYVGPDRAAEEQVPDPENDLWTLTRVSAQNQEPDTCLIAQPCLMTPTQEQQQNTCGWAADELTCEPAFVVEVVELPPALVEGVLQCETPGLHGWCLDGARITLQAEEPLQGETITQIESNLGILCDPDDGSAVSCSWSAGEQGAQLIRFWAVSSYGDTSEQGQVELKLDGIAPQASLDVFPALSGKDGWYVEGPLELSPQGQDAASGVDTALLALEDGSWVPSISLGSDGIYQVQVWVHDQAGNETQISQEVQFDSHSPTMETSMTGEQGFNGWYRGPVEAQASALDSLSGLDEVGITLNGQVQDSRITVDQDGEHALTFWARDNAGNLVTEEGVLRLDQQAPDLDHEFHGQEGEMGWWVSAVELQALAEDLTSGVEQVRFQIDSAEWQTVRSLRLTDGDHTVTILAQDQAGNQTQQALMVPVDTLPPVVDFIEQGGDLGEGGWYVGGPVRVRAEISDALSGVGEVSYRLDGEGSWYPGNEASFLMDGVHTFEIRALDQAGNEITLSHQVQIDKEPPLSALTEPSQTNPVWVTGPVELRGLTSDQTSGVAVVELSLDGGQSYQVLVHDIDGR